MSKPSDKPKSDRQRVIEWYKEDIYTYNKKIEKYSRLIRTIREIIRTIRERIEALEKKELEEHDTTRELLTES